MKSHSFLSTFIRYAFTALVTLYIVYWLADFHINDLPGFTLQEGFMIAGEALVFCAFILAFKDTRPTMSDHLHDELEQFAKSIDEHNHKTQEELSNQARGGMSEEELLNSTQYGPSFTMKKGQKTVKGSKLSEEHKKKISESLKRKNAEKKAQQERIQKTATASQKRKAAKK